MKMNDIQVETHNDAEVFVLPPELLEKLGINLCNIDQTPQKSQKSKRRKNKNCIKRHHSNHELNNVLVSQGSSILETADLMKNSVLLSPTFVPVVGDTIPGEIEIAKNIDLNTSNLNIELNVSNNCLNNNFNQENDIFEPCHDTQSNTFFGSEQSTKSRILKEIDSSIISNEIGRTNVHRESSINFGDINMKKPLNSDDVKCKLKLKCLKSPVEHKLTLKSDIQYTALNGNLHRTGLVCHTNTNNNDYEIGGKKVCVVSTLDNFDNRLESEEPLVVPASIHSDVTNLSHTMKDQQSVTPIFSVNQSTLHNPIDNSVNSNLTKFTNCDEKLDMDLDNILHETKIFIPVSTTTASTNIISNECDDIIIEELNELSYEKGQQLNNVADNNILLLPSELTNISNITQNINDTEDINIDILYESFDEHSTSKETEFSNRNQEMVSNVDTCESEEQTNGLNVDIISHIDCDETSDMELDNMLRETEILISTSSKTSICDRDTLKLYHNKNDLHIEEEMDYVFEGHEVISPILEHNNFGNIKRPNSYILNSSAVIEAKSRNIIINHNGSINKVTNYETELYSSSNNTDSVSTLHLDHILSTGNAQKSTINKINTVNVLTNEFIGNNGDIFHDNSAELNFNNDNEPKLGNEISVVEVNNYSVNDIEAKKSQIVTKTDDKEIDEITPKIEGENVSQSPGEIISNNQYKKQIQQTIDSFGGTEKVENDLDVSCNSSQDKKVVTDLGNKVEEIAKYLKKAYKNKKMLFEPKVGIHTKSKIFIHGVEKPGGSGEQELVFNKVKLYKTYEKKKVIQIGVASRKEEILLKATKTPENNSTEINTFIEPSVLNKRQEFCLCYDFGKLPDVTEYNNLYEHIHFGSNRSVNCPVNSVFEIYDERTDFIPLKSREYIQEEEINNEYDSGHICWQKFEYQEEENIPATNILNENTEVVDNTNLTMLMQDEELRYMPKRNVKKLKENTEAVEITNSKLDLSSESDESGCISKQNVHKIQENDTHYDDKVSSRSLLTKLIEDNIVAPQLNTNNENNIFLEESGTEKNDQHNKTKTDDESRKNVKRKIKNDIEEPPAKKNVKCGVCEQLFAESEWEDHISKMHYYIAWKDGHAIDFENLLLLKKIKNKLKSTGSLICTFCGYEYVKLTRFLSHVKSCFTKKGKKRIDSATTSKSDLSICGVCQCEVSPEQWIEHISEKHQYLAWKVGESPLDLDDENKVKDHLLNMVKKYGCLICSKCGLLRKYTAKSIKNYLIHIEKCSRKYTNVSRASRRNSKSDQSIQEPASPEPVVYKCAVCEKDIDASKWSDHASREHNYRTWIVGKTAPKSTAHASNSDPIYYVDSEINTNLSRIYKDSSIPTKIDLLSSDTVNSTDDKASKIITGAPSSHITNNIDSSNATYTCGVCNMVLEESTWIDHIKMEHNYLAWRAGDTPLDSDDKEAIWHHLHNIKTSIGKLICPKCGKERKYPKNFLQHVKDCNGSNTSSNNSTIEKATCGVISHVDRYLKNKDLDLSTTELTCGVCQKVTNRENWITHMQTAHNYIAWIDGATPLDLKNQDMIREHLQKIVDEIGALVCANCGTSRKYAKKFLQHMRQCSVENQHEKRKNKSKSSYELTKNETVICGACTQTMRINEWMGHVRLAHNYIGWKDHQAPIKSNKPSIIEKRLRAVVEKVKELKCPKCGFLSTEVQLYLQHSESCTGNPDYKPEDDGEATKLAHKGLYQCAICHENIKYGKWKNHAVDEHYNVAWVVGDEPIDLLSQHEITKVLNEYLKCGGVFACKVCRVTRSSAIGFYAHFTTCGLTEEECDKYKMSCDICSGKYLGIYKWQHMALHTQQELAKERKQKAEEDRARERERRLDALAPVSGRRRAAEKARMVIEETARQIKHVCQQCGFATDVEEEMTNHKCPKRRKLSDDVDLPLEQEESSDEEDLDAVVNESDVSQFEDASDDNDSSLGKRKHADHSASSRITRIPFVVADLPDYLSKNAKDFADHYLTTDTLFPEWTRCNYEIVPEAELMKCLPPVEDSCQVYSKGKWKTYKRWKADVDNEKSIMFAGYNIQRVSWVPTQRRAREFLSVSCHAGLDCPQLHFADLFGHQTLVQIWDFDHFTNTPPQLVMGLVIPFGAVWAMDWCPSGARECLKDDDEGFVRMGLLAVACSNGFAYILSVPYPSTVTSDSIFCRLEPVAQLKFTMKSDRPKYQATSISWSKQKGHSKIVVGYSDGIIAYYDLNTESPFLKAKENNVTIFYPFFEEHIHNGCVTDLSTFPLALGDAGAVSSSSPAGSALGCERVRARVRSHLAAAGAAFLPAWPAVWLAGDDAVTMLAMNELEYWGMGRRAGPAQACCGCLHCGAAATFMAPFLRIMRPHHARPDLNRMPVAWIGTKQLGKKRKHNEDKKEILSESIKYEDTIKKYGIEFKLVNKSKTKEEYKKSYSNYREINPQRFPLVEVPSMAFCPSPDHHKRLAVATHAGLIFLLKV
ncbi:uncharacterized protein LOC128672357 isoform X2 [Plodia interpunctella]|uniref:uncharacterized protein LOC128672357 isoform X2 n=1 Tax=Plodia interpunctella TaxID=58824 RepID=UPI002368BCF1|nr:uncharacterized protein LOC128672357 isoform X2 [Plodia interpunctella]